MPTRSSTTIASNLPADARQMADSPRPAANPIAAPTVPGAGADRPTPKPGRQPDGSDGGRRTGDWGAGVVRYRHCESTVASSDCRRHSQRSCHCTSRRLPIRPLRPTLASAPIRKVSFAMAASVSWVMFSDLVKITWLTHPRTVETPKSSVRSKSPRLTSNYLARQIAEELADGNEFVSKASTQLLKHHGTYQQDDRERRAEARVDGAGQGQVLQLHGPHGDPRRQAHQRPAAGRARPVRRSRQHHAADHHAARPATARRAEDRTSSRRSRRINEVQLTTLAACGDVKRNVMCSPCPYNGDPVHEQM